MAKKSLTATLHEDGSELFLQQVGQRVRDTRIHGGITLQGVSEFAGLVPSYLYTIEQGTSNPTLKVIYSIAEVLKVSPRDLMPGSSNEPQLTDSGISRLVTVMQRVVSVMEDRESQDALLRKQLGELTRFLPDLLALVEVGSGAQGLAGAQTDGPASEDPDVAAPAKAKTRRRSGR